MSPRRGVVFLVPTSLEGQQGPSAAWLNAAGWVAAASRLGFRTTVITSTGVVEPTSLRIMATTISDLERHRIARAASRLPLPVRLGLKDAREWLRAGKFARLMDHIEMPREIAFVWQRHELFHSAGERLARKIGCPLVLFVTAPKIWEARVWGVRRPGWSRLAERMGDARPLHRAELIACVSDEVAHAVTDLGVGDDRIIITPSTADTDLFRPDIDSSRARRDLSLEGRFVVGWAGSFRSFHSLDMLLDVIRRSTQEIPNLTMVLVGSGPERARVRAEIEKQRLEPHVVLTGQIAQSDLPAMLAAFDVAVVPSRSEQGFHYSPLKLWEYLAMGLPVVAPAVGVPDRMLTHGFDAMLYNPGDTESMAAAIVKLERDPQLRASLRPAARAIAEAHSWARQLEKISDRLHILTPS